MQMRIIISNVIGLISCCFMIGVGMAKDNKTTIIMQTIQMVISGLSCLIVGSIPAVISNWGVIPRNFLVLKKKYTLPIKIAYTIALTVFAIITNNIGWMGILPMTATFIFCMTLDTENKRFLKLIIMITLIMWIIHDFYVQLYVNVVFDIITFFSSLNVYLHPDAEQSNNYKE